MPLNPEIFFRGAELQARNAAQTQATIGNFFDKLAATKERKIAEEKAKATDYEGSAYRVLEALQAGREPDPADIPRALTWDKMNQAQNAVNPSTGEPFPKNNSIFGSLQNAGGAQYPQGGFSAPPVFPADAISIVPQGQGAPMGGLPMGGNRPYANDIGLGNVDDMVLPPVGDNYAEVAGMPAEARPAYRGLPVPTNTKQRQTTFEAQTDLAKQGTSADIGASAKQAETIATKRGEQQASTEAKLSSVNEMISELEAIGTDTINKLPGGTMESLAASVTNMANVPNAGALAQARVDVVMPILLAKAKEVTRGAGEGTFTDADQKLLNGMVFDKGESTAAKLVKYNELLAMFKRSRDRLTGKVTEGEQNTQGKPGFRYLGTE